MEVCAWLSLLYTEGRSQAQRSSGHEEVQGFERAPLEVRSPADLPSHTQNVDFQNLIHQEMFYNNLKVRNN